jgi:hypothetical protein
MRPDKMQAAPKPEVESRLSDIALSWLLQEAVNVPNGLLVGPVYINEEKIAGTGDSGPSLYLNPADDGLQHSEMTATRDKLDDLKLRWLAWLFRNQNYSTKSKGAAA